MSRRHIFPVVRSFRACVISLAVLVLGVSGHTRAMEVQGIYRAEVPVASQEETEREQAFKTALETVLVSVGGTRDVLAQPPVQDLLASASRYVQQFGYRDTQPMTLWAQFDGVALRAAMREADLPIWAEERPAVLVWLAVERRGDRYMVGEDSGKEALQIVQSTAARRGVPILLPLLDLEDRAQVSVADVLAGFDDAILEASGRYAADAVAIARVTAARDDLWSGRWQLEYGGESLDWDVRGATMQAVLTDGMHAIADALGTRLAVVESAGPQGGLLVSIEGVDSLEDYARLDAYLDHLELVQYYRTYRVAPGHATFWMQVSGDEDDLSRSIALGNLLEGAAAPEQWPPGSKAADQAYERPALHFRLLQ